MIALSGGQQLVITILIGIVVIDIAWVVCRRIAQSEREPLAPRPHPLDQFRRNPFTTEEEPPC